MRLLLRKRHSERQRGSEKKQEARERERSKSVGREKYTTESKIERIKRKPLRGKAEILERVG